MLGIKFNPLIMDKKTDYFSSADIRSSFDNSGQLNSIFTDVFVFFGTLNSNGLVLS